MFVSTEEVLALTSYEVTPDLIARAQAIIEVFVGRTEPDVDDPRDFALLARATAFQAAYMSEHGSMVYEQINLQSLAVGGTVYTFRNGDKASPYVSPLAAMACAKLSWLRARGVRTGRLAPSTRPTSWWTE